MFDRYTLKVNNRGERIQVFLLVALCFYLVLPYSVVSIILGLIVLSSFLLKMDYTKNRKVLLIQLAFYFILALSLFYSENFSFGLAEFKRSIVLLILPFSLLLFSNSTIKVNFKYMRIAYVLANIGIVLVLFNFFLKGIVADRFPNLLEEGFIPQLRYLASYPYEFVLAKSQKNTSTWFINHKTLLALNFLLASLFSLQLFFLDYRQSKLKYFFLFPLLILIPMIIYTQALVNIALLSVLFIYVWLNLKKNSNRIIFSATTIVIAAILVLKFNIVETFNNGNTRSVLALCNGMISGEISEEADPRLFIYYCDKELLAKQIVFGYGVGDVQDKLNACYIENNFKSKYKSDRIFNSHNYFIHLWLAGGILTMLLFIFMLFFNARLAFTNKDYAYLFFLFFVGVNLLFDNILLRFQGALYFALFNSLFLLQNLKAE